MYKTTNLLSFLLFFLFLTTHALSQEVEIYTSSSELITIQEQSSKNKQDLLINIVSYRGLSPEFTELLPKISGAGLNVWTLDLVDNYMLPPTPDSLNKVPIADIISVIRQAKKVGYENIFLYSISKTSNLALKVANEYQQQFSDGLIKGHIMHVPEIWITNHKTSQTKINDIANTSNLPIYLIMTEYGTKYHLTNQIVDVLQTGGSPVFIHKIKGVRSGFHVRPESHLTDYDLKIKNNLPEIYKSAVYVLKTTGYPQLKLTQYEQEAKREYGNDLVKVKNPYFAPHTRLSLYRGGEMDLSSLLGKNVLVNFWASWCGSCATEIPSMTRLKDKLGDKLEIITINIGEKNDLISNFLKDYPFDFPILKDLKGEAMRDWKVFVFPSNFILNKKGKVVYTYTGSIEWDEPNIVKILTNLK